MDGRHRLCLADEEAVLVELPIDRRHPAEHWNEQRCLTAVVCQQHPQPDLRVVDLLQRVVVETQRLDTS
jgi:hypothetical protein